MEKIHKQLWINLWYSIYLFNFFCTCYRNRYRWDGIISICMHYVVIELQMHWLFVANINSIREMLVKNRCRMQRHLIKEIYNILQITYKVIDAQIKSIHHTFHLLSIIYMNFWNWTPKCCYSQHKCLYWIGFIGVNCYVQMQINLKWIPDIKLALIRAWNWWHWIVQMKFLLSVRTILFRCCI